MMRSLYSGVAGLKTHQTKMDVIGNNVANVNTTGFKRGRVNFQDMISQQMSGAASPTTEVGGVNPKEVGLGVTVAAIDTVFTQGNLQTTGVSTDVAIQGNGFFIMNISNPVENDVKIRKDGTVKMYRLFVFMLFCCCSCRNSWRPPVSTAVRLKAVSSV